MNLGLIIVILVEVQKGIIVEALFLLKTLRHKRCLFLHGNLWPSMTIMQAWSNSIITCHLN